MQKRSTYESFFKNANKNNCKKQRHRQHAVKEVKFTQKSVYFSILRKSVELSRILKSLPHIWKENIIMHLSWRSRRGMRWPMIKVKKFSRIWNSLKKAIFFGHSRSFVVAKCQNIKPLSWKCMSQCIFSLFESRPVKLISVRINQGQADRVTQIKMLNLKWAYTEKKAITCFFKMLALRFVNELIIFHWQNDALLSKHCPRTFAPVHSILKKNVFFRDTTCIFWR